MKVGIYVEGAGDSKDGKAQLRQGFDTLLAKQKDMVRKRRGEWRLTMCKSRGEACRGFLNALEHSTDSISILLVDSEGPVEDTTPVGRVTYLQNRDNWDLTSADPATVHLMIQCVEAWLVADPDAQARVFGKGFHAESLPKRKNLDEEPKNSLEASITKAARATKAGKEGYKKVRHAAAILTKLDPDKVAEPCPSFR